MAEVACYRLERALTGCADTAFYGDRGHPISVLEMTKIKVDESSISLAEELENHRSPIYSSAWLQNIF